MTYPLPAWADLPATTSALDTANLSLYNTAVNGLDTRVNAKQANTIITAVKTANYAANPNEFVPVDTTSGNVTVTFPTAPANGTQVGVKMVVKGGTNTVTLALGSGDHFNTAAGPTSGTISLLNQDASFQYVSATAVWMTTSDDLPLSQLDIRYSAPFVVTAVKTASYSPSPNEFVPVDTTSGNVTLTLPTAPANMTQIGAKHIVRGGVNTVTLAVGGSDHFNTATGPTTVALTVLNQDITFQYNTATAVWLTVSDDVSLSQMDLRYKNVPVALTFSTTLATNAALGNYFRTTVTSGFAMGTPTNPVDGQEATWEFLSTGGPWTLTVGSAFSLGGFTGVLTTGKRDFMTAVYNSVTSLWYVTQFAKNY